MNISTTSFNHSYKSQDFTRYLKVICIIALCLLFGCISENKIEKDHIDLFDGKTLGKWQVSDFIRGGNVYVKDNSIYIEKNAPGEGYMQGITWAGPLVKMNYEITLEAMRIDGSDFFCGLTFPVGENPCTLILGGWGGTLCGLSCLDYQDASENETTTFVDFNNNQWYKVRLKVVPGRIQAWLDSELLVDVDTTDKVIDVRFECDPSIPLGIATYNTTGRIRDIKLYKLPDQPDSGSNLNLAENNAL